MIFSVSRRILSRPDLRSLGKTDWRRGRAPWPVCGGLLARAAMSGVLLLMFGAVMLGALSPMTSAHAQVPRVYALNPAVLQQTKSAIDEGEQRFREPLRKLRRDAEKALDMGPFTVTAKEQVPPGGDKHDYMSMSRYWWPDPGKPDGLPYIRRDGEVNPEVEKVPDHENLSLMARAVSTLAAAYYFTGHEPYAEHAAILLRAWFLDSTTAMNPRLQFAQAIKGRHDGGSPGVLEGRGFVQVVDAVGLLQPSPAWTAGDQEMLKRWFEKYLQWLLESELGRGESAAGNNHGIWYDVQTTAIALFVGRDSTARRILLEAKEKRIARQIEPDGRLPRELARTLSEHYTHFALQAFFMLAGIGERVKVDLWRYKTTDGKSIRKALEYTLPVLKGERSWPDRQISPFDRSRCYELLVRGARQYPDLHLLPLADQLGGEKARAHVVNLFWGYGR
jgi:hypothetical protein